MSHHTHDWTFTVDFGMVENADCGLWTADCTVRCEEKTECGGVHNFIFTNSKINFCFLCQNMYFKYNMEYG